MDSFLEDSQLIGMKRKFENSVAYQDNDVSFGNIRHNLLGEFEEADISAQSAKLARSSSFKKHMSFSPTVSASDSPPVHRQLKLKDAEIAALKASITKMENRLASVQRDGQQAVIEHDKEMAECRTAKDREVKKAADLKSKLQYVMEREKNAREEVQRLEKELQHQAIETNKKLLGEQRQRLEAGDKAQQAKEQWMEKEAHLHEKIMSQKHKLSELQSKYEESIAQLALKKSSEGSGNQKKIDQLEEALQAAKTKVKDLESRFAEQEDNIVATRALKADLDSVPSMKIELEKLRHDNEKLRLNEQNTLLLEEEIHGLKKKLSQIAPLQEKNSELELENEELKGRLSRWEITDTSGSRRPQSPSSLSRRAQELEATNTNLLVQQGEMQTKVNLCERRVEQAEVEKRRLTSALSAEKNTTTQLNDLVKRLKRKMLLQSKERDAYKGLLDSYESEVTVNFDAEKASQIQRLESILHEYQEMVADSEAKIESLSDQLEKTLSNFDQVQQQLQIASHPAEHSPHEAKETIKQLRENNAVLESNLLKVQTEKDFLEAQMEHRILQGDYDPSKTKIIHMPENPFAKAQRARQEELGKLREDNERLKKRNQILEENGGQVQDITIQVEEKLQHTSPSKEVEDLKSQLASAEMRNQRLKEIFAKTSKEFREVCYQLTGYRFDIPCANQYRLTSMYAERQKDYLLFQQNSLGEIQLLQTDFSMAFQDAMENDLQKLKSLPLFLSHITIELFSRQTMSL